jgi:hypothetical protein
MKIAIKHHRQTYYSSPPIAELIIGSIVVALLLAFLLNELLVDI